MGCLDAARSHVVGAISSTVLKKMVGLGRLELPICETWKLLSIEF
jgi:hypothetical protein